MNDPLSAVLGAEGSMLRRPVGDLPSTPLTPAVHQEAAAAAVPADDHGPPGRVMQLLSRLTGASQLQLSITPMGGQAQQGVQQQHAVLSGEAPLEAAELGVPVEAPSLEPAAGEAAQEGRAAEIAAAHRLLSTGSIDLHAVASSIEKGLPFVALLAFVFVSQHIIGLTAFGWLSFVLFRLNQVLRQQVALKAQLQPAQCTAAGGVVVAQVLLVLLITWQQRFWRNLVLVGSGEPVTEFWEVLFDVVVVDALVRYLAVLAKVAVLLVSRVDSAQLVRRRGHALTAVEYMFAFYRGLLPIPLWYGYFKEASSVSALLSTITSGLYLMLKCTNVYDRLAAAGVALRQAWLHSAYGSAPSQDEISEAGNSCPICQDNLRGPVKLHCGHIFCDDCVSEWLERERTCPMCRAAIRPSNLRSHADGHTTLLPIVF